MNECELLFVLLRNEVCGQQMEEGFSKPSPELLKKLCTLSAMHDLAHIPGQALKRMNLLGDDPASVMLDEKRTEAIYRYIRLDLAYEQASAAFEQARIPFIPLKGTVLRQYYPEPWMRTSCDIDILVKETDLDRAIEVLTKALYCQCGGKGDHDISLYTAGGVHIELHFDTIQERYAVNNCRDVLAGIWEDAKPDRPDSCAYHMSDEMYYFYHIAHMAKHFGNGGCGVRTFLDVWILNHKVPHDRKIRETLLRKGGLLAFAHKAERLAEMWFSNLEPDAFDRTMSNYILRAGVYGNNENRAAVGQARVGGKVRYILLRRVFMPYDYLKAEYLILGKHKWLFPFYQLVRWFSVLRKGLVGQTVRELQANSGATKSEVLTAEELLKKLEI